MRYAHLVVWATVALTLILVGLTLQHLNRESSNRRVDVVASCERGNVIRHVLNTLIVHAGLADDVAPLPILDCQATVK